MCSNICSDICNEDRKADSALVEPEAHCAVQELAQVAELEAKRYQENGTIKNNEGITH